MFFEIIKLLNLDKRMLEIRENDQIMKEMK